MCVIGLKLMVGVFYVAMITVNFLANYLPFYGRTTGEISAKYPTLFTPAGFTFSIWGVIYILLGILVVQLIRMPASLFNQSSVQIFVFGFIASCIFNALWLVFWHRDQPIISTTIIALLLISIIIMLDHVPKDMLWIRIAVSVYLGWVSIATIANVTIALFANNFGFGIPDSVYFIFILIIGIALCAGMVFTRGDILFSLVFVWAYFGIFMRHLRAQELLLYSASGIGMVLIMILVIWTFIHHNFIIYQD